ncbi:MAG: arginine--tRNA ligase [Candidatus Magasanikbacteria bacterium]|nr:arginine--tRNA ligase [Candidatus Magasanikbacteria bacterium]
MQQIIIDEIKKLLTKAGVTGEVEFSTPPKSEMGDAAFPCFTLAKELKKNPVEVANDLALKLGSINSKVIESVKAFGPYVNFFVRSTAVVEQVVSEVLKKQEHYGESAVGKGRSVMVEYPSNNTHKEFHIGHFRNVCIGNALVQLYQRNGYMVYPVNYLNDFGAHVAKCLWGLQKFHMKGKALPAGRQAPENKQAWLGEIYAEASRYLKDHPEAGSEVAETQKKLEARAKTIWPLFLKTRRWSLERFDELFKELGVKHIAVFYEKDLRERGQKIVDELLQKKVATVGEGGAIIVDLTSYGLDIALVRKSNGIGLYLTSDLPLAEEKFKKFAVDESIVITGQEQSFYFRQLYKILELMGFQKKLTHLSYGLVNLPAGKMSSRTGNVILYEALRDEVLGRMTAATAERHGNWPKSRVAKVARALTQAALKFDFQKHESAKMIAFDVKEATSFEGFSGPYVLYVVARINSLLGKAVRKPGPRAKINYGVLVQPEEKQLALILGEFSQMMRKALGDYNPSVVARYAFDVAQAFNDFYNKQSILNAGDGKLVLARLSLCQAVRQVLQNTLHLLTIETVEEM